MIEVNYYAFHIQYSLTSDRVGQHGDCDTNSFSASLDTRLSRFFEHTELDVPHKNTFFYWNYSGVFFAASKNTSTFANQIKIAENFFLPNKISQIHENQMNLETSAQKHVLNF